MDNEKQYIAYLVELMQTIGPVYAKAMFGGHGIYLHGLMFGLVEKGTLYLKVDKESELEFKQLGLEAFTYNKKDKVVKLSYFQAPDEAMEDSEEMNTWANKAYSAALRSAAKKKGK